MFLLKVHLESCSLCATFIKKFSMLFTYNEGENWRVMANSGYVSYSSTEVRYDLWNQKVLYM